MIKKQFTFQQISYAIFFVLLLTGNSLLVYLSFFYEASSFVRLLSVCSVIYLVIVWSDFIIAFLKPFRKK